MADLTATLTAWLAISMPVCKWRTEPEIDTQRDFICDEWIVKIYARGFFDVMRPLKDQVSIFMELP